CHVVGHIRRRVRTVRPVGLTGVPGVEDHRPKSCTEMALRSREGAMVAPKPTQENEGIALGADFLIVKRATSHSNLGHGQTEIRVVSCSDRRTRAKAITFGRRSRLPSKPGPLQRKQKADVEKGKNRTDHFSG